MFKVPCIIRVICGRSRWTEYLDGPLYRLGRLFRFGCPPDHDA
jgi:hypothetical protein